MINLKVMFQFKKSCQLVNYSFLKRFSLIRSIANLKETLEAIKLIAMFLI
jgi:hypothetical protein